MLPLKLPVHPVAEGELPHTEQHESTTAEEPGPLSSTPINTLTDDCLIKIFSLLSSENTEPLPIARPPYRDVRVYHPLQCALVCKAWRTCARAAVHSLTLSLAPNAPSSERDLACQVARFVSLKSLCLATRRAPSPSTPPLPLLSPPPPPSSHLPQIASATPGLETLDLDLADRRPADVASALASWRGLRELRLRGPANVAMQAALLDVLPRMTALEILLTAGLSLTCPLEPGVTWDKLGPRMPQLRELGLQWRKTEPPPMSMASLPSLRLSLVSQPCVPPQIALNFRNVVELQLVIFRGEELPPELGSMSGLERLAIVDSDSLRTLPDSLGGLGGALKLLELRMCRRFGPSLPPSLGELAALRVLRLVGCCRLQRLPEEIGRLTALEVLDLEELPALRALPRGALQELDLEELPALRALPKGGALGGGLPRRLRELRLSGRCCYYPNVLRRRSNGGEALREVPGCVGELRRLTSLAIGGWPRLAALPESLGSLASLRELRLEGLPRLGALPESLGGLTGLESLAIVRCGRLSSLPAGLGRLSALTRLHVARCGRFEGLPERGGGGGGLSGLRELRVEGCGAMRRLPAGLFSGGGDLRELVVRECGMFCDEAGVISRMKGLRYLELIGCLGEGWDCLPGWGGALAGLAELRLLRCSGSMMELASGEKGFPKRVLDVMEVGSVSGDGVEDGGEGRREEGEEEDDEDDEEESDGDED